MATQNAARAKKVEIVDEVKTRMGAASAHIVSEYRGLSVAELAELRTALEGVGADYRIFKNTLVRLAIDGGEYQPLSEYLSGPTALTFVDGDISAVAKALRDFSRANPLLVIKGGLADGSLLSSSDLAALAELPPREVLLARLAGAIAAPMQQMAGLLQALPRNLAYGMQALIDQRVEGGEAAPVAETAETAETAPRRRRRDGRPRQLRPPKPKPRPPKQPKPKPPKPKPKLQQVRPPRPQLLSPPRRRPPASRKAVPRRRPRPTTRPSSTSHPNFETDTHQDR